MTPENEQLKARAEAAKNANSLAAKEYRAFNTYATPERILALIVENERADTLLKQVLEVWDNIVGTTGTSINAPATMESIRTYLEGK